MRNEKCVEFVDLTRDSPEKLNKSPPKNTLPETCLKNNIVDNSDIYDTTTSSSVTSWTTSSLDDIICSKNPVIKQINYKILSDYFPTLNLIALGLLNFLTTRPNSNEIFQHNLQKV